MSYFSLFPKYLTRLPNGAQVIITDLFRRIEVSDRYKSAVTTLMPYTIIDGEQPEMVSNKIYGSPHYHWVILLVNDIISVPSEWPLSYKALIEKIYYDYNFEIEVPDVTEFSVGDVISTDSGGSLTVVEIGYTIISAVSNKGQTFITSSTIMKNETTGHHGLLVLSATDPQNLIHHYEDITTGYQIDNNPLNPNCVPVTNIEYEINENEKKRNILILDPTYLQDFITKFRTEIS